MKLIQTVLVVGLAAAALQGCVLPPLLLGGAVAGAAFSASDRRTSGTQLEDEGIELKASARIREQFVERTHINVTSYNRQVLITGEVPDEKTRLAVEKTVSGIENVKSVVNELAVLGNSTLGQRSSDSLVTGKVKAALVDDKELFANAFKITTERGAVYMMGRVTDREAKRATEIVRGTNGVQKVVRVLEIISEDEFKRLQPKPAPAPVADAPTPVFTGTGGTLNNTK